MTLPLAILRFALWGLPRASGPRNDRKTALWEVSQRAVLYLRVGFTFRSGWISPAILP